MKRRSPCKWLSWDDEGRPSCEHGPAHNSGSQWGCPEKGCERSARWRRENPEKAREQCAQWRRENPEKKREENARRVGSHEDYVGMAPTPEIAADLNNRMRQFAASQKEAA